MSRWYGPLLVLLMVVPDAQTGGTDPMLSIAAAQAQAGATTVTLAVDASFLRGDVVQVGYPVQLLLWEEGAASYLRYALAGGVYSGQDGGLADGLNATEAAGLLSSGTLTAEARVLRMDSDRLELGVPASFPVGPARVQLFVVDGADTILSNPIAVTIPSVGAP